MIHFAQQHLLILLFVFGIVIRLPLAFRPITAGLTDTWREADTAAIAHNFYWGGFRLLYPQIQWGGAGPGYVEAEFQIYTWITAQLYRLFGENIVVGRLVSLAFMMCAGLAFYLFVCQLASRPVALWSLFFFMVSPITIRYSIAVMPEAVVLFFYCLALYLFHRWTLQRRVYQLLLAGCSTSLAILVKPTAINIGLVFLLTLFAIERLRFLKDWRVWTFTLISLVPPALWLIHARYLYLTYGNTFGVLSGGDSKLGNLRDWTDLGFYWRLLRLDITWVLTGAGVALLLIGLVIIWRRKTPLIVIYGLITMLIYYMLVARYSQQEWGIQYHIYLVPYAGLGVGIGLHTLVSHLHTGYLRSRFVRIFYPLSTCGLISLMLIWTASEYTSLWTVMEHNQNFRTFAW